jgi:methionyl-tRNA synthetase
MKKFYITTPIYYPNARPHVGSAYTTIACDAIARYKRMCGYDVAFLTGTDEHGEKLQRAADEAGVPVEQFVAEKRKLFKELWRTLGLGEFRSIGEVAAGLSREQEDGGTAPPIKRLFVHTSQNPDHVKSVQWMIRQAKEYRVPYCPKCDGYLEHGSAPANCPKCGEIVEMRDVIYKKRYEGRYCVFDERYVSDSPELANCDICGRPAELISEENYFFRLSAFKERLLAHYKDNPDFVQPVYRRNEVKSFVKSGLRDISISRRRLKWGIPWPDDPEQVVYVWYDALTSYLTGIGFAGDQRSKDFEKYWPADVHMIGKDILRFHAVYWPAFLWAAGLPLPKTVFAHGWIYYEQDKMSKSKGNVVYPEPIIKAFEEFGAPGNDALRYYLLRDTPFGEDGSFSYEGLLQRYNSDLAKDLGNLAHRVVSMVHQYCGGAVPDRVKIWDIWHERLDAGGQAAAQAEADWNQLPQEQRDFLENSGIPSLLQCAAVGLVAFRARFEKYEFSIPLDYIWAELVAEANKYLTENAPWKLAEAKSPDNLWKIETILSAAAETVRLLAVLLAPVMPASAARLWRQLGCEGAVEDQRIDQLRWGQLKPGTRVGKPEPIFPRLDEEKALRRLHELAEEDRLRDQKPKETSTKVESPSEQKPVNLQSQISGSEARKITIEDFAKVDLRAGTIISAEPIPGATKLLKLQVDIGSEVRQVCAGIAEYYKPEELIGMKVVIVANLQPRKMRGVESNGMIVAASVGEQGKPVLVTFKEEVPNGARLK